MGTVEGTDVARSGIACPIMGLRGGWAEGIGTEHMTARYEVAVLERSCVLVLGMRDPLAHAHGWMGEDR